LVRQVNHKISGEQKMTSDEEESLLTPNSTLLEIDDDDLFIKPKKKHKILFISDHQLSTSGVGTQSHMLIQGLISTGKYTFRCLGGAIKHQDYRTIKVNDDYYVKPVDGFGSKEMIRELLLGEKPDAIVIFTDPRQFIWLWEMQDEIKQICPITYWHVWDNDPYPQFNNVWFESTDLINCLSYKTYEMVKEHFPEKTNYIPHAWPKNVMWPIPEAQLDQLKAQNLGDRKDWFKCLWVNRNATRKLPSDVLETWKIFLDNLEQKHGHRNAMMIMHTDPKDIEGPDLLAVSQLLGLQNNVWFSTEKLDFPHMNIMYNMADCVINISKAEGFGLATLCSLQVGKPIIALCTGGETRQVIDYRDGSEHGVALKPAKRMLVGSQMVPYIYEDFAGTQETADAYMKIFEMTPEEKTAMAKKCIDYVDHEFSYEKMVKDWDATLDKCIVDFKAKKSLNEGDWSLTTINPTISVQPPVVQKQAEPVVVVPKLPEPVVTIPEVEAKLEQEVDLLKVPETVVVSKTVGGGTVNIRKPVNNGKVFQKNSFGSFKAKKMNTFQSRASGKQRSNNRGK